MIAAGLTPSPPALTSAHGGGGSIFATASNSRLALSPGAAQHEAQTARLNNEIVLEATDQAFARGRIGLYTKDARALFLQVFAHAPAPGE